MTDENLRDIKKGENMSKVFLVGHTGSINRGCEAIIRSTVSLLNNAGVYDIYIMSYETKYDSRLGIDKLAFYLPYKTLSKYSPKRIFLGILKKLGAYMPIERLRLKPMLDILEKDDIVLVIGGDTYCYGRPLNLYACMRAVKSKGAKIILWSCSIEDKLIDKEMVKNLVQYDYIFPREKITYDTLCKHGIKEEKLLQMSDSAFNLDIQAVEEYKNLENAVGINISSIVVQNTLVYEAVKKLISHIVSDLNMKVILIPHVYDKGVCDDKLLHEIKDAFCQNLNVDIVDKFYNCKELKYIISKCKIFVGARTHATIAAYSECVPTLVLGYSVKSRGIAVDLFGTECGYAIMYDCIESSDVLCEAFDKILKNEKEITRKLQEIMPGYKQKGIEAASRIAKMSGTSKEHLYYNKDSCTGCGACVSSCPKSCIEMSDDEHGFLYPKINTSKCIECGICAKVCPLRGDLVVQKTQKILAAYATDDSLRAKSSSGGIFGVIAKEIINSGGVVFGAVFDDEFNVVHKDAANMKELSAMYGSKYVQSHIGNCFKRAKELLENNTTVLFVGTPCQIGGLKAYLKKDYDNLITMDFICHGVSSPKIWKLYRQYTVNEAGAPIESVQFRSKEEGWRVYSMYIKFKNGKIRRKNCINDEYLIGFIQGTSVRESCNSCGFKGIDRESDITVGDFWGINNISVKNDFLDDKGVSLVAVRSTKANILLDKVKDKIEYTEVTEEDAFRDNLSAIKSLNENPVRDDFFKAADRVGFDKAVNKYCGRGIAARIRRRLKRLG